VAVASAVVALVGACIDSPAAPKCSSTSLSQTGVKGDTVTLSTGLRYIDTKAGSGKAADWCIPIVAHYTEYLADGTRLESSHDTDQPLAFTPGFGDLIDGFEQGVIGMRNGGTRRLIVPPNLAYGAQTRRNQAGEIVIPANSTLIYDVEAFNIPQ
jgi:FKBP-type peptidyl-prolyl cis-trans isomerase FkpA